MCSLGGQHPLCHLYLYKMYRIFYDSYATTKPKKTKRACLTKFIRHALYQKLYNKRNFKACAARKSGVYLCVNEHLRASVTQKLAC